MSGTERGRGRLLLGCCCGLAANAIYIAASILLEQDDPPVRYVYPVAWLFGPLLIATAVGVRAYLDPENRGLRTRLGGRFMGFAGALATVSIAVRGVAENRILPARPDDPAFAARWLDDPVQQALMLVQRSLDLGWETFLYLALGLFGWVMLSRNAPRVVMGGAGILLALLGLAFNAVAWPRDPEAAGLVAMGPFAGMWFLVLSVLMGIRYRRSVAR